jgi:hypothetical protein
MSGLAALSLSRVQLMLLAGAIALAFFAGAAKASAADVPLPGGDGGTVVVPGGDDDGGLSHTDPYGKG